ncbi:hypothetical protein J5N97_013677 [Dioscorea zingiberensis]|uniref:Dof zinc finger protein n=1 Tax=Dioscorea zingiberensis TaxID=325984 RepID=A0A9D5CTP9_9LILI|nr:hypothetical protein J5N97_013677 [Dioscorea zingiberensis]
MEISNPNFQIMASHSLEEVVQLGGDQCSKTYQQNEKKPKPDPETALKCPRCESTNTKFCYYNNYSLSQPRYFCKGCRRYWTKGGSLRNVPVGGGCRKNKKSSKRTQDHQPLTTNLNTTPLLPTLPPPPSFSHNHHHHHHHPNDHLTLNFDSLLHNPNPNPNTGFLDILRSGFLDQNNSGITPTSLQNLYHGFDGGLMSSSQESCKAMEGEENKVLMGLQWQLGVDSDSGSRDHNCWNGGGVGSPWHGLINSSFIG